MDDSWEKFARSDPYWSVITDPRFRTGPDGNLPVSERKVFFASGREHITHMSSVLKTYFGRRLSRRDTCIDFGSGVGRLLIPMAQMCGRAIGVDISPTMRRICLENAREFRCANVECHGGLDHPDLAETRFDWVNSFIVFQHMDTALGMRVFDRLLQRVKPGGVISIHFTIYKSNKIASYLVDRYRYFTVNENGVQTVFTGTDDYFPSNAMMMNDYDVTRLYMILGQHGFHRVLTEHVDHAGMNGLIFFSMKEG